MNSRKILIRTVLISAILLSVSVSFLTAQNLYPPEGWITDIRQAQKIAQEENRKILVNFTGSDWCSWCFKLRDEVFLTPAFRGYAEKKLVLLFVDFPNRISLSGAQRQHNQILAQTLGVQGYPTIFILEPDLTPRLKTGYTGASAAIYNLHLEADKNIPAAQAAGLKTSLQNALKGIPSL